MYETALGYLWSYHILLPFVFKGEIFVNKADLVSRNNRFFSIYPLAL